MKKKLIIFGIIGLLFLVGCTQANQISTQTIIIDEETDIYIVHAEYPEISNLTNINEKIKTQVIEAIDVFKDLVTEEDFLPVEGDPLLGKSNIYITYETTQLTPEIISIAFTNSEYYSGTAHPNSYTFVFNYNVNEDNEIELSDLFNKNDSYVKTISEYSIKELQSRLQEDEFDMIDWIEDGAGPKEVNFLSFTIGLDGMHLVFDPYQVAPYSSGPQRVVIPWKKIEESLNEKFLALIQK